MFDKVEARFALRAFLVGVAGFLTALQAHGSPLTWTSLYESAIAGAIVGLGYAGIGAASKSVEPSIGRTADSG